MTVSKFIGLGLIVLGIAGCSTIDKITGQTDDTVLPGQRENAIPGKAQFPEGSDVATAPPAAGQVAKSPETAPDTGAAEPAPECPADDPGCAPPADGTFSDPQ